MAKRLEVKFDGSLATIEFTTERNEFTTEFIEELNKALDKVLSNPETNVLVTYNTGKHYSDGIALTQVFSEGLQKGLQFTKLLADFLIRLMTFPMPTVAAVNGHAFAGGCLLALCHDYRVMNAERGWICMNEIHMPQMFPVTLLEILRVKVPIGAAQREMITMGRQFTGPEAVAAGFVDQAVPSSKLLHEAISLAKTVTSKGSYGREIMEDMKKDLYRNVMDSQNIYHHLPPYYLKSSM